MSSLDSATESIIKAVRSRYPQMSRKDAEKLASAVLKELSQRLENGEDLAFFRLDSEGIARITRYALEKAKE